MNLSQAVDSIRNVTVNYLPEYQNVQFVTPKGVTISVGYGLHHYSSRTGFTHSTQTVEVYIWKSNGATLSGGKFGIEQGGILGYFPAERLPELVAHIARYIR